MSDGLGAAGDEFFNNRLDSRTRQIFADMLDSLRAIPDRGKDEKLVRNDAIDVLTIIESAIGKALEYEIEGNDDDLAVYAEHHVPTLIKRLLGALTDLGSGKTDPVFIANKHGANASLSSRQREKDKVLLEAFRIYQAAKGRGRRKTVIALEMARNLNAGGYKRREKKITWKRLIRLQYE
jgi:hypothetical protein